MTFSLFIVYAKVQITDSFSSKKKVQGELVELFQSSSFMEDSWTNCEAVPEDGVDDGAIEESDDLGNSRTTGMRMKTNNDESRNESEEDRITGDPCPTKGP